MRGFLLISASFRYLNILSTSTRPSEDPGVDHGESVDRSCQYKIMSTRHTITTSTAPIG